MYCIKKFSNCWAVINLETDKSRPLSDEEVGIVCAHIPSLADSGVASYFTDSVDVISDKP